MITVFVPSGRDERLAQVEHLLLQAAASMTRRLACVPSASKLSEALAKGDLCAFACTLREQVAVLLKTHSQFATDAIWRLIDAVWFWNDVRTLRWKFLTTAGYDRYLDWADENARLSMT